MSRALLCGVSALVCQVASPCVAEETAQVQPAPVEAPAVDAPAGQAIPVEPAPAQPVDATSAESPPAPVESKATESAPVDPNARYLLLAGTEVHLRLLENVASDTHKRGDRFKLEVIDAVVIDSHVLVPAGAVAEGEVIHASRAGMAGRPGELIITSRLIRLPAHEVKLRSFIARTGKDDTNLATGMTIAIGVFGLLVRGGNFLVPSGTEVVAKVAAEAVLPAISAKTAEEANDDVPTGEEDTGSADREPAGDAGGVREQPGTRG